MNPRDDLNRDELKHAAVEVAAEVLADMHRLARDLHDHPELSGEEHESSRLVAGALSARGFDVTFGAGDMETAFVAGRRLAGEGPVLAYLAEYDALPDIGHGCGHNLIAAAAVGAALVVARVAGAGAGELRVIGTPAEETVGGKVILVENGVFDDVDAALMVHPGHEDRVVSDSLACASFKVVYTGKAAHAVAHPEKGVNALDALLALFAARDALLRRSRTGVRIPGIITQGGVRPNIIPDRAVGRFSLRARRRSELDELVAEFRRLTEEIGRAHGCGVEARQTDCTYNEMVTNQALAAAYRDNLTALGVTVNDRPRESMGSLDMGNVSYAVPSVHPFFAIVPPGVASHTLDFARATMTDAGRDGLLRSIRALAMTGIDLLTTDHLIGHARREHHAFLAERVAGSAEVE